MEETYKLFAFDPCVKYPTGCFAAYEINPDLCNPAEVAIGEKCTVKPNPKSNARFSAVFLYEGDVEVCLDFKYLLTKEKRTTQEVMDANGSEEEAANASRDADELRKQPSKNAGNKRRATNGRKRAKKIRINSEEEFNNVSFKCPIVEAGEESVKYVEKEVIKAEEVVKKKEEERNVAADDARVAQEAVQAHWKHAHTAVVYLQTLVQLDKPRKMISDRMKEIRKCFKKWEEEKVEDVSDDEDDEVEDPNIASVRRGMHRLHKIAKDAETEKVEKTKILEETEEQLKEAKNNLNILKKEFKENQDNLGGLRKLQCEMMNTLKKMKNPVLGHDASSKMQQGNDSGEIQEDEGNGGDIQLVVNSSIENKAIVGTSRSSILGSIEQLASRSPLDGTISLPGDAINSAGTSHSSPMELLANMTVSSTSNGAATPQLSDNAMEDPEAMPDEPNNGERLPGTGN